MISDDEEFKCVMRDMLENNPSNEVQNILCVFDEICHDRRGKR